MASKAFTQIKKIINKTCHITEVIDGGITMYKFTDKRTGEDVGNVQLSVGTTDVAQYSPEGNRWHKEYQKEGHESISVNFLSSEKRGYGKLFLAYGVLSISKKHKKVKYSTLDDDSDKSNHKEDNIYSKLGYTPSNPANISNEGPNHVKLGGPEKQVLIEEFVEKVNSYILKPRSRSRSRSQNKTRRTRGAAE